MKWFLIALCLALGMPFTCHADDGSEDTVACEAAYAALPHGTILDLLDPKAPADRRASALAAYERLATMKQCPEFGYTLGQLYRHGAYLPGNVVAQDFAKARELILPMAEDGYLPAFADLAEMEMRQVHSREAMKWTQVYLYFVDDVQADYIDDLDTKWYQHTAYNSQLLSRTDFIWRKFTHPPLPDRLVKEDLDAYLAQHEDRVARRMRERMQGQHQRASAQDGAPTGVANDPSDCYLTHTHRVDSASASWIVEVLPSGKTGRIVLENFVPNAKVTKKLERCVSYYTFVPFAGTQSATVRISMVMGSMSSRKVERSRRH